MSCKYCNLKNYTESWLSSQTYYCLAKEPYTTLEMMHDNNTGKYSLIANGDYVASIEINFCPICGRKLTGE